MTTLKALTWNVGEAGRTAVTTVEAMLRTHKPHVVVITEAYGIHDELDDIVGYQLRQLRKGEGSGIAVLVRDDVRIRRGRLLRMARPWVGPKLLHPHAPRIFRRLVLQVAGRKVAVDAIHFPPGGPSGGVVTQGRNAPAWRESARRVGSAWRRGLGRSRVGRRLVLARLAVGDFNATAPELEPLAREMGAVVCAGSKVDHALIRGMRHVNTIRVLRITPHPPLLFTFDIEETR